MGMIFWAVAAVLMVGLATLVVRQQQAKARRPAKDNGSDGGHQVLPSSDTGRQRDTTDNTSDTGSSDGGGGGGGGGGD